MIIRKDQEMISQQQKRSLSQSYTTKDQDNMPSKPPMRIRRSVNRMIFSILFNVYGIFDFLIYIFSINSNCNYV